MRTVFLAVIPILTAILGYLFSVKYGQVRDFWDKFGFWHKKIKSEIAFSQNSLPEIFGDSEKSDVFSDCAREYVNGNKKFDKLKFLSNEETEFLNKYLQNLGRTDKDSQLNFLNSFESELEKFIHNAEHKSKTYRPLCVKLGFLIGLIIFILLI